jgi:hypothetical protein
MVLSTIAADDVLVPPFGDLPNELLLVVL